jgi:1-acyl-sn-glycerol-3-phosphate acyltransferase
MTTVGVPMGRPRQARYRCAVAYWVMKALLSPFFYLLWRVKVEGRENVPKRGPVILAPNHVSFVDSMFVPLVLARRVTFVAKAEYFDSFKTAWFFRASGQIPMRRDGGSASERALAAARDVLNGGGVLGIYPEGTRSPDGRLYRGHTGVARLALGCKVPVVPVGLIGTPEVQPIGAKFPRPFRRVTIRFGAPLDMARFVGEASEDPLAQRTVTDELMFEIRRLSGQHYVDRYAKRHNVVGGSDVAKVHHAPYSAERAPLQSSEPAA